LACPICRSSLHEQEGALACRRCGQIFEHQQGILVLLRSSDAHKQLQASFFDAADAEFEIERPRASSRLYQRLVEEKFRRSVESIRDSIQGATALVVCGGSGMEAEFLASAGAAVTTADISVGAASRAVERARRHGFPLTSVVADVEALPFRDQSFDLVFVHDGLHHLEQPEKGILEMARVARRAVSINEPVAAGITHGAIRLSIAEEVEEAGNVVQRIEPSKAASTLSSAGFRIVSSKRYGMVYRHHPGRASRVLSHRLLFPFVLGALQFGNTALGRFGNKTSIQAVRVGD
jgi:ubiquinone/menaquinone biosynthesis C-methylase UbiE